VDSNHRRENGSGGRAISRGWTATVCLARDTSMQWVFLKFFDIKRLSTASGMHVILLRLYEGAFSVMPGMTWLQK
jgi:hypothetical protein